MLTFNVRDLSTRTPADFDVCGGWGDSWNQRPHPNSKRCLSGGLPISASFLIWAHSHLSICTVFLILNVLCYA